MIYGHRMKWHGIQFTHMHIEHQSMRSQTDTGKESTSHVTVTMLLPQCEWRLKTLQLDVTFDKAHLTSCPNIPFELYLECSEPLLFKVMPFSK